MLNFEVGHFQSLRPSKTQGKNGCTPLHFAAKNGHKEVYQGNQMNEIPDRIEEIETPIYQSSMLSKKSIESTQVIQSSQLSEDSTQLFESSQLSNQSKVVRKKRGKNKRELSYLDNSCILPDCKRTRNKK